MLKFQKDLTSSFDFLRPQENVTPDRFLARLKPPFLMGGLKNSPRTATHVSFGIKLTRGIDPMLEKCWLIVCGPGPVSDQFGSASRVCY